MKIALIIPGSIWFVPYVRNYPQILDKEDVRYDIIYWNREEDDQPEGFQYNVKCGNGHNSASFSEYRKYIQFIKKTIKREQFDRLIVSGLQMTCLLSTYLLIYFRNRYMIDYRYLSIEQRPGFRQIFSLMLKFSYANVISSPTPLSQKNLQEEKVQGNIYVTGNTVIDALHIVVEKLKNDDAGAYARMSNAVNPYGDGKACQRIAELLK